MLDAFIIERIRQDRERERQRESARQPLRIERGPPPMPDADHRREREEPADKRGSTIIDFQL